MLHAATSAPTSSCHRAREREVPMHQPGWIANTWKRALGAFAMTAAVLALSQDAAGLSYVALGDSVAVGIGDGGGGGYVARYRDDAEVAFGVPITLQNLAVSGSTSQDWVSRLTTDSAVRAAVSGADLVTFDIGGNDLLQAVFAFEAHVCGGTDGQDCFRQAIAAFDGNWQVILTELRTLNPTAMMRTMTYYNPLIVDLQPGDGTAAALKPYGKALNATIRSTGPTFGIAVAEGAVAFNGAGGAEDPIPKGYIDADHIHPSPLGYDVLAEEFDVLGYSPVSGTSIRIPSSITLKDDVVPPFDPTKRSASFKSSTRSGQESANRIVPPPAGGSQDPRTAGATLTVYNATGATSDRAVVALPEQGWSLAGTKGFRFKGAGPATAALVIADKLKVNVKGAGFDYSLDEMSQGAVAVRLTLGGGGWCAAAAAKNDLPGRFVGQKNAPAPASCPPEPGSASGAFLD